VAQIVGIKLLDSYVLEASNAHMSPSVPSGAQFEAGVPFEASLASTRDPSVTPGAEPIADTSPPIYSNGRVLSVRDQTDTLSII